MTMMQAFMFFRGSTDVDPSTSGTPPIRRLLHGATMTRLRNGHWVNRNRLYKGFTGRGG